MKKVAVFGNTGGGKSTLAKRLAELTQLPLYPLGLIQFRPGGGEVPRDEYLKAHAELLQRDAWIIDGFGCVKSAWERWPAGSPMISSTINSYRVIWLCHRHLTSKYRALVSEARHEKRVHHLRPAAAIKAFLNSVKHG